MHDYTELDLSPRLEAILNYATLLAREPSAIQQEDLEILRKEGLTDEEILSVVLITCNFSFMTRLADGLGVQLDDQMTDYVSSFLRAEGDEDTAWLHEDGKAAPGRHVGGGAPADPPPMPPRRQESAR